MSWSINLSGKNEDVQAELEAAYNVIDDALRALVNVYTDSVSVNINGHGYTNEDGSSTFSAGYSVNGITPTPVPVAAAPEDAPVVADEAPVVEEVPATPTTIVP
jgi:hypothetical protein